MEKKYKLNLSDIAKEVYEVINSDLAKDERFKEKKSVREDKIKKIDNEIQACEEQKNTGARLNQKIWEDLVINMDNEIKTLEDKKEKVKEELKEFEKIEQIYENSLEKAEERYNDKKEEIEKEQKRLEEEKDKKTDELFEKKKKYGIKVPDNTHGYIYRYTKEEKVVVEKIENEMNVIEKQYDSKIADFQTQLDENKVIFNKFRLALKIEKQLKEFIDEEDLKIRPATEEDLNVEEVKPESSNSESTKSETEKVEPVKPEPEKNESVNSEIVKTEEKKDEHIKTETPKSKTENKDQEKVESTKTDEELLKESGITGDNLSELLKTINNEKEEKNETKDNDFAKKVQEAQNTVTEIKINSKKYNSDIEKDKMIEYTTEDARQHFSNASYGVESDYDWKKLNITKYLKKAFPESDEKKLEEFKNADPNIVKILSNNPKQLQEYADFLNGKKEKNEKMSFNLEYNIRGKMPNEQKKDLEEYAFINRNIAKVKKTPIQAVKFAFKGLLEKFRKVKALPSADLIKTVPVKDEDMEKITKKNIERNMETEKFFSDKVKTIDKKNKTTTVVKPEMYRNSYDDIISFGEKYKVDNSDNHIENVATEKTKDENGFRQPTPEDLNK